MSQPFETQGRLGRLKQKPFTSKDKAEGLVYGFNHPPPQLSLIFLNLEGNRFRKRKAVKFWIERLIINSTEELGFRGTCFHLHVLRIHTSGMNIAGADNTSDFEHV